MSRLNQSKYDFIYLKNAYDNDRTSGLPDLLAASYKTVIIIFLILFSLVLNSVQAAGDTGLEGDDRYAGRFPIGFNFQYYDKSVSHFYASTNGLLQFSNPTIGYNNQCLPAAFNNTLYVFWDDLRTHVDGQPVGKIEYQTLGEAPNRKLVVQWTNQYFFGSNLPMGTFQAILFEGTHQIKYQYRNLLDDRSQGNSATIGLQGPNGQFEQVSCDQAGSLRSGQAITFTLNDDRSGYIVDTDAEFNFIDISGLIMNAPEPNARYTNQAPVWTWTQIASLTRYQIEIQNNVGEPVHQETVGNTESYVYNAALTHGQSYRAKIRGSINDGGTWESWSELSTPVTVDLIKPTAILNAFERMPNTTANVAYQVSDDLSGLRSVQLQIATDSGFTQIIHEAALPVNQTLFTLEQLPTNNVLYARIKAVDNAGNSSEFSATAMLELTAPMVITPVNGTKVTQPEVTVSGKTYPNATVIVSLNGITLGTTIVADDNGDFSANLALTIEQTYRLSVKAQTSHSTTPDSYEVTFSYQDATGTVMFATPAENATLSAPTEIAIVIANEVAIDRVVIYANDAPITTLTALPYRFVWNITESENGAQTLKAIATASNGKTYSAQRLVTVDVSPVPVPPTAYTGKLSSIMPSISYGQPIIIEGLAIDRTTAKAIANAPLRIVLINSGFQRYINVSTDDSGYFSYRFVPQQTDKGRYGVAVIHPKETNVTAEKEFYIDRVSFNFNGYHLTAARNIPAKIAINATMDSATNGLYWLVRAEDQPNGQLPEGISIISDPVSIPAGATAPTYVSITADDNAADFGTIVAVARTLESDDIPRGKLHIQYRLTEARSVLYTLPNYLETGLAQEESITEVLTLANRGLTTAGNLYFTLQDQQGNAAPSWVFLSNADSIRTVGLDDKIPLNITAQPDSSVSEGIYRFVLHIRSDNQSDMRIPVIISVVQNGTGAIRFDVADLYTSTLDENNQPIPGVADATIKLYNETVFTEQYTLKTDVNGIALASQLPPFICTALRHRNIKPAAAVFAFCRA